MRQRGIVLLLIQQHARQAQPRHGLHRGVLALRGQPFELFAGAGLILLGLQRLGGHQRAARGVARGRILLAQGRGGGLDAHR
ncbi:hypothetical protein D3C72_2244730 [compost metagenome]